MLFKRMKLCLLNNGVAGTMPAPGQGAVEGFTAANTMRKGRDVTALQALYVQAGSTLAKCKDSLRRCRM